MGKKSKNNDGGDDEQDAPLSAVERLQSLNLVSRIASETSNHLGISDRTLAEFVIDLAERRIRAYAKAQFVKEGGLLYDVYLKDDIDDPSSPLRVGLISSAIERDIDILSSFRNDLMSNGAGEEDY